MDELGLPSRLFKSGFEPYGRKCVNSYFKLRWLDLIKNALENDHLEMLNASQFGRVLQMGGHTFSLVTEKDLEIWWLFVGKHIHYAIQDFALVTGLNCGDSGGVEGEVNEKVIWRGKGGSKGKASNSIWDDLFRGEEKPTVAWIMDRLVNGKRYKDSLTRFGFRCWFWLMVVSMLGNIDEFLKYAWGSESFLLTAWYW
ncbi:hypothetical protein N665_1098s0001 [Sinapis alba]|nr:hypothetical protein N665_1098s0001 [Sinapis alba]